MAKSTSEKKMSKATGKSPAAFATQKKPEPTPSKDNPSRYQPGKNVEMDTQALNPGDGLKKLFIDSIRAIYWAENQLLKALPKMAKAAGNTSLSKALLNHLKQTEKQVTRLEQVFKLLGQKIQAKKCDAMEGLAKEGEGIVEETDHGTPARDIGIIMASQKVEHYEIASYTGLVNLAKSLGFSDVAKILSETLTEEQQSDKILAGIATDILASVQ